MSRLTVLLASAVFLLTACGGDDSPAGVVTDVTTEPVAEVEKSKVLSGTAAAGAAILGKVIVKGGEGKTKNVLIKSDGSFEIDVSELAPPYRLRAEGRVGGREYRLHSYSESAEEGQVINITPFTDLIVANAAGQLAANFFDAEKSAGLDSQVLIEQEKALSDKLAVVLTALGVDATVDLLRTSFSTDHTGLDAALDMIQVEVDEATNVATLKNVITAETIVDDLAKSDDNQKSFEQDADLGKAQDDFVLIGKLLSDFSALFEGGLPSKDAVAPYFAETFLEEDTGKAEAVDEAVTEPENLGLSFSHPSFISYDAEKGIAKISMLLGFENEAYAETLTWELVKNQQGQWQFNGDQVIVEYWWNFHCNAGSQFDFVVGCGINVGVEDSDPANTPGAPGTLVASAKFYTERNGTPVSGSTIYLGQHNDSSPGELWVVHQGNYQADWMAFDQIAASAFAAGDIAKLELYTGLLDLNDPNNPVIPGDPVQTVTIPIMIDPVTSATRAQLPSATEATLTAFQAYQGGEMNIEWTMPDGTVSSEIWLTLSQQDKYLRVDDYIVGGKKSVALSVDASSLQSGEFDKELRVYTSDQSGYQLYSTFYHAKGQIVAPN